MIDSRLHSIESRIQEAAIRATRSADGIKLIAVSKTHSVTAVQEAYDIGLRDFGESRVQELLEKRAALPDDIRWHFIGRLQSNKVKAIVPVIHLIHSVDSLELAREIDRRAKQNEKVQKILIQVNISGEGSKSGASPAEALSLMKAITADCSTLQVCGLMGMASPEKDLEKVRPQFSSLRLLYERLKDAHPEPLIFTELSMGMTSDFEVAIAEGSTMIRIGSALFGDRNYEIESK